MYFTDVLRRLALTIAILSASVALIAQSDSQPVKSGARAPFELTRVSIVHLTFSPAEFAALTPDNPGGGRGGFGRPGGPGAPAGQGAPAGGGGQGFPTANVPANAPAGAPPAGRGGGRGGRGGGLLAADGRRNGMTGAMGVEFEYVHADVAIDDQMLPNVGVRYKGNGTYMQGQIAGKLSFKLQLNHFDKGQKIGRITTLNLHSNISDATFMNETLAYLLYRDAGVPAPQTSYARVYLTVTGQQQNKYLGLYAVVENPDEAFFEAHRLPAKGAIFKPVTRNLFSDLGPDWAAYNQAYDAKTKLTDAQKQRVIDLARLVTSADDSTFVRDIGSYVDLEAASRYFAVCVFLVDLDGLLNTGQNYYMHLNPRTGRFSFTPWDQDHSWGQFFVGGTQQQREELDILHPWLGENRFLARLFGVEAFRKLYLARMREFSASIFDPARIASQVDEVARAIRAAVGDESAPGLARFDRAVNGESLPALLFNGRPFGAPNPVVPIKSFAAARARAVKTQLERIQ